MNIIEAETMWVLIHTYSDHSAFTICGVTKSDTVAFAWYRAGNENDVVACREDEIADYADGFDSWKKLEVK